MSTPFRLQVPREIIDAMLADAAAELPNECCGLLAGRLSDGAGWVTHRYPLVNAAASPREYLSSPESMFAAVRDMHLLGIDVLAVYHSHPTSEPVPSRADLERNYSPDVINLIISFQGPIPQVQGWWLTETDYREAAWDILDI